MLATNGPQWFDRRRPDSSWSSVGISMVATGALFASAFVAMTSARSWIENHGSDREAEVAVRLAPPVRPPLPLAAPIPKAVVPPVEHTHRPPAVLAPPPATVPPLTTPMRAIPIPSAIVEAPIKPGTLTPDSAVARPAAAQPMVSNPPAVSSSATATGLSPISRAGAPMAPAGVTRSAHVRNTPSVRDSLARARMAEIPELARHYVPHGADLAAVQGTQQADAMLHRRSTSVGVSPAYLAGSGVDGVGAVGPGTVSAGAGGATNVVLFSIPFPLFYPGPSPERRRRDSIVNADNLARLARLKARADSLAARKIVP